jgi:hypothetical protein
MDADHARVMIAAALLQAGGYANADLTDGPTLVKLRAAAEQIVRTLLEPPKTGGASADAPRG